VGGKRVEAAVVEAFLEVTAGAGEEAAALADEHLRGEIAAAERTWQLQIEKAEYEARRAERQYASVEPENRTVARELERRWEQRLVDLEAVRAKAAGVIERQRPLSEAELVRARELGRNLDALWEAETTTVKDRKRLLRCLIEEVQLRSGKNRYHALIAWKGGSTTEREVVRFAPGGHVKATPLETVALVRELAREFDDSQIARILNRQGRRSGRDLAFTKESVTSLRGKNRIPIAPKPEPRDEREGPFTLDDAGRELGVTTATVQRWLKEGLLVGQQSVPGAPCEDRILCGRPRCGLAGCARLAAKIRDSWRRSLRRALGRRVDGRSAVRGRGSPPDRGALHRQRCSRFRAVVRSVWSA
jgi:hypothetical protein